ncbi:hypothetical protein EXS57_00560 [Candidatus Kaiserbacteria bacterium]|nr:hypothetical protein [Candidatus Kaiserbacteria bacterium]
MKRHSIIQVLVLNYIFAVITTCVLFYVGATNSLLNNLYGVLFLGFIPVVGGINGLFVAKRWGLFSSTVGRAITFLSFGLIAWGIGTYVYSGFYNLILQVEVPYPSLADIGYILALPFWAIGMIQLSRATGAQYGLRSSRGKMVFLIVPFLVVAASYYLLITVARGGSLTGDDTAILKVILDLTYPLGDVVILTFVTVIYGLAYDYFGGFFKKAIYMVLFGFVIMYFADFSFSYTTTLGTWFPGDWNDLLFVTAMLILSCGVAMFDQRFMKKEITGDSPTPIV